MITDGEKSWLKQRENLCARCFQSCCGDCCGKVFAREDIWKCRSFDPTSCLDENIDLLDAADFEARVAEKLAREICFRCPDRYSKICPKGIGYFRLKLGTVSCGMKHARLAVEAEMDDQSH